MKDEEELKKDYHPSREEVHTEKVQTTEGEKIIKTRKNDKGEEILRK